METWGFLWIITHVPSYQRKNEFHLKYKVILSVSVGWKRSVLGIGSIFVPQKNLAYRMHKARMKYIRSILNFIRTRMRRKKSEGKKNEAG